MSKSRQQEYEEMLSRLQRAFDIAEGETSDYFGGQTCSMKAKNGFETCPICYFRIRVREHLKANYGV